MTHLRKTLASKSLAFSAVALFALAAATSGFAQTTAPAPRISGPIVNSDRVTLTGSRSPLAIPANDLGAVPADTRLDGISLVFSRTPAQQAALDALIAAQQNPASPLYHQWLTPDQFAAHFGVADSDISAVSSWLQLQGFSIDSVARSRNRIVFSGTAGLVATAFGAPLHYYKASSPAHANETHFAPSSDLTIPAALGSSVLAITNLSSFRPHPHIKFRGPQGARPAFTSSQSGNHYITPGDLATIYDVTPAYNAGFTGSNQSIAILGQSAVQLSDILAFQTAVNITAKTPQLVLVPSTGASTIYSGDESESDLDLEYSSTVAKGAQVYFVYAGSDTNADVFTALTYAVDERIAPIISSSYGDCEPDLGSAAFNSLNAVLEQAATQGQTVLSAAGDDGSTDCYGEYASTDTADNEQLAVDFPASSQYVTGLGGTEFPTADVAVGNNTYFTAQSSSDVISSALSYIPEMAWNDDPTFGAEEPSDPLGAGGGGVSIFAPHPSWQTGTIGGVAIPSSTFRLVPDISLTASPINAPFAYCTSDTSAWSTGQVASCNDGLRDASSGVLTVAGGTSFDAPSFAGMLALILQSQNSTGEGVINSTLYTLAATSAYATAFHDITAGGNQCTAGSAFCSTTGADNYASATGYDEATGLGSIDLYNLLSAWPKPAAASLTETAVTLVPTTTSPATGVADTVTITVAETNILDPAIMLPTGTVALTIDGVAPTTATTLTLTGGVATYSFSSTTAGSHVIVATYSGDATNAPSEATLVLTVGSTAVGSFTLAAGNISVASGASASSTITVTPSGGYTGTVDFSINIDSVSTGADADLADFCYTIDNSNTGQLSVTGTAAVTAPLTIYTSLSACATEDAHGTVKRRFLHSATQHASNKPSRPSGPSPAPIATALAGLLALGVLRKRFRRMSPLLSLSLFALCLGIAGLGLSGCSNNASTTGGGGTVGDETPGTYSLTLIGTDSVNANQTASANFTLTITQ
jgi:subtilase family serine protease